ncbi:hypothetical protein NC653_035776 [Populus alba x Populus x berolinensis]|uniref:Uncharacterized protein n=1 Tax=Populus alba x Populus x berolinensis TaxID=444605 RepID=A0AAD6LIG9_9ROSI|nr:hypothetical protein NC653_035776 [Populus alba x Populus x berolinensis]
MSSPSLAASTSNYTFTEMSSNIPNDISSLTFLLDCLSNEGWSKARRLSLPLSLRIKNVEISGSCKGILCISDQKCYRDIFLLNPSIGVFKLLLPFSGFNIATVENSFALLGFGYLQEEDDYKVIRCVHIYDKPFIDIDSYEREALESTL